MIKASLYKRFAKENTQDLFPMVNLDSIDNIDFYVLRHLFVGLINKSNYTLERSFLENDSRIVYYLLDRKFTNKDKGTKDRNTFTFTIEHENNDLDEAILFDIFSMPESDVEEYDISKVTENDFEIFIHCSESGDKTVINMFFDFIGLIEDHFILNDLIYLSLSNLSLKDFTEDENNQEFKRMVLSNNIEFSGVAKKKCLNKLRTKVQRILRLWKKYDHRI